MSKYIQSARPNRAIPNSLNPHKDRIIELYRQGHGTRPIARAIGGGVVHTAIYKALIRWGVKEERPQWNKGRKMIPGKTGASNFITPEIERDIELTHIAHEAIMEHYREEARAVRGHDAYWARPWLMEQARRKAKAGYAVNRQKLIEYQRLHFQKIKHTGAYVKRRRAYTKQYRQDPGKRIKHNLSVRMANLVRGIINGRKFHKSMVMLGCTEAELKAHLEAKFTKRMTWANYGSYWHVDHIVPISYFNLLDEQEMMRGCHYTNLRPLTATANMKRGNRAGLVQVSLAI